MRENGDRANETWRPLRLQCESDSKQQREGWLGQKYSKVTQESLSQSHLSEESHVSQMWVCPSVPAMFSHQVFVSGANHEKHGFGANQQWILECSSWSPRSVTLPCGWEFVRYMPVTDIGKCMSNIIPYTCCSLGGWAQRKR